MLRFPGFAEHFVGNGGLTLRAQIGGSGPPLLLLHGHPQTQAMWHRVVTTLAERFTVVACDLRGYGDSSKPAGEPGHLNYSKRAMARDPVAVMRHFGFERFSVMAHDRGARVAHRLAVDHAACVDRLVLLDIAPTLAMFEQTTMAFASAYFHWFFLIQPAPLPETLISADSDFYFKSLMGGRHAGLAAFAPEALAEYLRCGRDPAAVHGMCEDYRAAATIDLEHDRADRAAGVRLGCPLLVLWGEHGVIRRCFDPLAEWRRVAVDVQGHALPCGHYIAEEAPAALLEATLPFLT
jgi:haloacetate dehalogenase